ncbi:Acetyltransferase (GNAT) family protein [Paenibacillus sp. UNCCL117]|uniref:GNAT family N-acetyltransferase n=1 Tax=unclassified Paenibacillus TaxID=185978 RepID=UPI0008805137|nr:MULTISPECIES: GNAT family N-acetyltransferase [unclassified Paenibacillus]SDC89933.1 Acetyltransferase (GNAT) family protein [Paenibacillus sp. cl123]SFW28691.1 Acetyltransferase (GNAT) family protein [Paenibacillus sp. UNCCL117]
MEQEKEVCILSAAANKREEIAYFVLSMMSGLYPKGSYDEQPDDLAFFEDVYVRPENACFFIAESRSGGLIGTAAVKPYDRRFPEVESVIGAGLVCEAARFYIHPDYRRKGVGRQLFQKVEQFARRAGYGESYLHTSTYLPGGYPFWLSCGYVERYWESDQIVHMSKRWP